MEFSRRLLLCLPVVVWVLAVAAAATTDVPVSPRPDCPTNASCGDIDVPFPFALERRCAINEDKRFHLNCTTTAGGTKLFNGKLEVMNISVQDNKAWIKTRISRQRYNESAIKGKTSLTTHGESMDITSTPYVLSGDDSKVIVLGCNRILGYIISNYSLSKISHRSSQLSKQLLARRKHSQYRVGCLPICVENPVNGTCNPNAGCCQLDLSKDVKSTEALFVQENNNNSQIWREHPWNYVTVMDKNAFNFSTTYLTSTAFYDTNNATVPVVMDWGITKKNCEDAKKLSKDYACVSKNSDCNNNDAGYYTCNCSNGYKGNPYLVNGCKDIDECENPEANSCNGVCLNSPGSFQCRCPRGTYGNP